MIFFLLAGITISFSSIDGIGESAAARAGLFNEFVVEYGVLSDIAERINGGVLKVCVSLGRFCSSITVTGSKGRNDRPSSFAIALNAGVPAIALSVIGDSETAGSKTC